MTFLEAALQILRSSRTPLTTQEITERALQEGLIGTRGKTPNASMSAVLYLALRTDGNLVKIDDLGPVVPGAGASAGQSTKASAI